MRALCVMILLAACGDSPTPAHPDAAVDAASTIDAPFPCSEQSCDKTSQYCYQISAGLFQQPGCTALPPGCAGQPTCACITPTLMTECGGYLSCTEHDGEVTADCGYP